MDLEMLLDLVVELWRQPHPASLASARLRQRDRDTAAPAEDHLVALQQYVVDRRRRAVALDALALNRHLQLFDLGRDLFLGRLELRALAGDEFGEFLDSRGARLS